jgi:hypothetical protein
VVKVGYLADELMPYAVVDENGNASVFVIMRDIITDVVRELNIEERGMCVSKTCVLY